MSNELKVLMMGGKRVGKSSALAAIMNSFVSGAVSNILTAKDKTSLVKKEGIKQTSINTKLEEVKSMLQEYQDRIILVDSGKTNIKWDYTLELSIPGSNDSMTITFTDVNGEFFEGGNIHQAGTIELVKNYDVFIVAVDTPSMMESRKNDLVNSIINNKCNCIDSIHTFLTQVNDQNGLDAKLVIFTPIKCEKWAKENKLDMVSANLKDDYKTTLVALGKYKNVQVEIIPIQTVGSIVFEEHKEAYLFRWMKRYMLLFKKENVSKCAVLDNGNVRLSDGTEINLKDGKIQEDASAVLISNSDMMRPNSWFRVLSTEYKPHNCEQLAFHILDFMLSKVIDAKVRKDENQNMFVRGLKQLGNGMLNLFTLGLWNSLKDIFGSISIERMIFVIDLIYKNQLIKRCGEGIQILNECNFKKIKK